MFNKATLVGNVGKDSEIKKTKGGKSFARFSLATSEQWRNKNTGKKEQKTRWHNIVVGVTASSRSWSSRTSKRARS